MEVRLCLPRYETQIGGADFDQFAARSQTRQGQGWIGAARDHQMQRRRKVVQKKGHTFVDGERFDKVVVVEDQDDLRFDGAEFVDQGGEYGLYRWRLWRLQQRGGVRTGFRDHAP